MVVCSTITWPRPNVAGARQVFKQVCRMQAIFHVSMSPQWTCSWTRWTGASAPWNLRLKLTGKLGPAR